MLSKKDIGLGPLVLMIQLLLLAVIGCILVFISFSTARTQLEHEIKNSLQQNTKIASIAFFDELERLSLTASRMASNKRVIEAVRSENWGELEDTLYALALDTEQVQFGVLFFLDAQNNTRANAGDMLDGTQEIAHQILSTQSFRHWTIADGAWKAAVHTTPITDERLGKVLGHLVYGHSLENDLTLPSKLRRITDVANVELLFEGRLLSSSPLRKSSIIASTAEEGQPLLHDTILSFANEKHLGYLSPIELSSGHAFDLGIVVDSSSFAVLTSAYLWDLVAFSIVILIGGLMVMWILKKLVFSHANRMSEFASGLVAGQTSSAFEPGLVNEFNTMGAIVSKVFNDLQNVNQNLESRVQERTAELAKAEERARDSEAMVRQVVNSAVDAIITINAQGTITTFNTAAEKTFGYSVVEVIGKNIKMLMPEHTAENHDGYLQAYLDTGEAKIIGTGREVVAMRKDGQTFLGDLSISEFQHKGETHFVGIIRDITERKEAEYKLKSALEELQNTQKELVQSEKMASLAGLVAGVAHEINTPVGVGLTAASHLEEQTQAIAQKTNDGTVTKTAFSNFVKTALQSSDILLSNLRRASQLIRSFKQVAVDRASDEMRTISLLDYFDEILSSLHPKIKRTNHTITVEGERDLSILTHPGVISQIVTNLVMNSLIHAYEDQDGGHITLHVKRDKDTVVFIYSDDGAGMSEDVREKIFEPFFTTKRGAGGSGLGMHILYNEVTSTLKGTITCDSEPGKGTTFIITFPIKQTAEDA